MSHPLAPWHLWGTSVPVAPPIQGTAGGDFGKTGQLSRINYGRPENWRFLFGIEVLNTPVGAYTLQLTVNFDLIIGVGRSHISIPRFYQFSRASAHANFDGQTFWTSKTLTNTNPLNTTTPIEADVDSFPAEDVQCSAHALAIVGSPGPLAGLPVHLNIHAYFAPSTHMRPDWFTDAAGNGSRFLGGEQGGK